MRTQGRQFGWLAGAMWAALVCGLLVLLGVSPLGAQTAQQRQSVKPANVPPPPPPAATPQVSGNMLDRVVAIVNGDLVLDSDVDEEQRFQQLQPYRAPGAGATGEFTREKAIERLINRDLILQQAALQPEEAVSDEDVTKELAELRKNIPACREYHCDTQAGWEKYLADHGFTEAVLRERWRQRMQVLRFIEERFRMGIRIQQADIKNYYEKTMLPEYARQHVAPPKLSAVQDRIQEVLLQQQVSALLGDWLKSLRAQGTVAVMHPGQEAP